MLTLVTALGIGLVIALPQLWWSLRYYPHSVRSQTTYQNKIAVGSIPLHTILRNLLTYRCLNQVDGVFHPEAVCYVGIAPLVLLLLARHPLWWLVLVLSISLAMGRHFPLFRWTHWIQLRNPSRYCYFISLALGFLAIEGFRQVSSTWQALILCVTAADLCFASSYLWPMRPYAQRWERPSAVFDTALTRWLTSHLTNRDRVSGLPYPLRTGQVNRITTLGYAGASCPQWMRHLRRGTHDWFLEDEDGQRLDDYRIRYAYTYRPLNGKWHPTQIPHLYQNTALSS